MNGVRSIFRRKGYLLTALSAAVLLAASSGTALAQVTVTGPAMNKVAEGGTVTYAVAVKGYAQPGAVEETVTVTLTATAAGSEDAGTQGELADLSENVARTFTVTVPAVAAADDGGVARAFSSTGSIRVQTLHDLDAEDEEFMLGFVLTSNGSLKVGEAATSADVALATGDDLAPVALTIEDDETQEYKLTRDDDVDAKEGGGTITVTVTADPAHVNGSADLAVQLDVARTIASITTPPTATVPTIDGMDQNLSQDIVITLGGNDKNRDEDTITLSLYSGTAGNSTLEDTLSIDVEDINALPAVAMMVVDKDGKVVDPQPESVMEGESIMVAVMPVDDKGKAIDAKEELKVALMPTGTADSGDYTLAGSFTIDMGDDSSDPVELEVRADEDVGMESLMFDATVSGEMAKGTETSISEGVLSLYIDDATDKKIAPKAEADAYPPIMAAIEAGAGEEGLNPGETITIMTSDLFTVMDGYTASYGVSVDGDSVSGSASGESVTIDAKMAGVSKVTVTGTARIASSSFMPEQTVSNVASITFEVMVVDTELVVTVMADPMEIAEGGMSTITATANRAITMGDGDVEIALTVVGDGELAADSIMIAMGEMSGYTMLTAGVDDDMDNETVTLVATGSGIASPMQVEITVMDDGTVVEPVPALPLFGQLLLALFMMVGGARVYRRRQG